MVEEVIKFKCGVCKQEYDDLEQAQHCENMGTVPLYPIGMIYSTYNSDMVFVITKQYPNEYNHHHSYSTWACRNHLGDTIGEDFCGEDSWSKLYPPCKKTPAYTRMIELLKGEGIKPTDYGESLYQVQKP